LAAKELKFETALERLEEIVKKLEDGDLPLEDSLKLFEEGVKLSRLCDQKLQAAERRIEILMKDQEGAVATLPFEPKDASPPREDD
jgi:exodeoxyribonuclease VII small subunit